MLHIREIDAEEPDAVERLFREYNSLEEGVVGVRFVIARRLMTVSIEQESPQSIGRRLERIRWSASLTGPMMQLLERWVEDGSSLSVRQLSIDVEAMNNVIIRENNRLQEEPEIINNTVCFGAFGRLSALGYIR